MDLRKLLDDLERSPSSHLHDYKGDAARRVSYRRLQADVRDAVARLEGWGVRPGMRVGVLSTNCYEWVVHDLALLELRCPSVAFPEDMAHEGGEALAQRYDLGLLLVSRADGLLSAGDASWIAELDAPDASGTEVREAAARDPDPDFDDLGLIFSSGSSGKRKSLLLRRRGVEQVIERLAAGFSVCPEDAIVAFLPLSNYQQRMMAYCAIAYGCDFQLTEPSRLFDALAKLRPTILIAPPLFYETLERRAQREPASRGAVGELSAPGEAVPPAETRDPPGRRVLDQALGGRMRVMMTGMAPIKRSTLEAFERMRLPLYQVYGLTECGMIACNFPGANRLGSVGRPLARGEVSLSPEGEVLVRRSFQLTSGYFEADAEDAAATYLAADVIATGDIGRLDEDGFLHLSGRKKEIIITPGGHKVHPEVIESQLNECPDVERSVVLGGLGPPGLAAVVCLEPGAGSGVESEVRGFVDRLNERLESPSRVGTLVFTRVAFTVENQLLTRNLKLNRGEVMRRFESELKAGTPPARAAADADAAPATAAERALAGLWCRALGVEQVGVDEDFFELGGDSILGVQVAHQAEAAGFPITPAQLAQHRTIRALARVAGTAPSIRAEQGLVSGDVAPTPPQLYLLDAESGDVARFCTSVLLEAREPLVASLLERAVEHVTEHHDALRLRLTPSGDGWRQGHTAPDPAQAPLSRRDLGGVPPAERERALADAVAEAQDGLDPRAGPTLRVDLLDYGRGEPSRVLVTIHFLVVDGVSWPIVIEDLDRGYGQLCDGRSVELPAKTSSYRDWAERQRQRADSPEVLAELPYWTGLRLGDVEPLPVDDAGRLADPGPARSVRVTLSEGETRALLRAAREHRVAVNELLLCAAAWTLREWAGSGPLAFTLSAHGREVTDDVDVSRTVGAFVSIFPTVVELADAARPADVLPGLHEQLGRIPDHGRSFGLLRYLSGRAEAGALRDLPLPQVGFNYRGQFAPRYDAFALASTAHGPAVWERLPRRHLLSISGSVVASRLTVEWEYCEGVHRHSTVASVSDAFLAHLRGLCDTG